MRASTPPLAGRGIVITRPVSQAAGLESLIAQNGGRPILLPTIEILEVEDRSALDAVVDRLDSYDLAIFISPSAVAKGWDAIRARRSFPLQLKVAAVGGGSAAALEALGIDRVIAPEEGADSESLLRLPQLQGVAGQRIVIFRGSGGREFLRDTLISRGASVDYAECYRRARPLIDVAKLLQSWRAGDIDGVVVTSSEGLRNLHDLLGTAGRECLERTPLFVPHARIAAIAKELGLTDVVITASGDHGIAASIIDRLGAR